MKTVSRALRQGWSVLCCATVLCILGSFLYDLSREGFWTGPTWTLPGYLLSQYALVCLPVLIPLALILLVVRDKEAPFSLLLLSLSFFAAGAEYILIRVFVGRASYTALELAAAALICCAIGGGLLLLHRLRSRRAR